MVPGDPGRSRDGTCAVVKRPSQNGLGTFDTGPVGAGRARPLQVDSAWDKHPR